MLGVGAASVVHAAVMIQSTSSVLTVGTDLEQKQVKVSA